jgi:hypothetical protein
MSRFPTHTVEDAPGASRSLLQKIAQSSPTGRPLNAHAQMAHAPAVLAAYTSLRAVIAEHGTLDPKVSWALNLATAATVGNDYMIGIASRFARMSGWTETQIATGAHPRRPQVTAAIRHRDNGRNDRTDREGTTPGHGLRGGRYVFASIRSSNPGCLAMDCR